MFYCVMVQNVLFKLYITWICYVSFKLTALISKVLINVIWQKSKFVLFEKLDEIRCLTAVYSAIISPLDIRWRFNSNHINVLSPQSDRNIFFSKLI